MRGDSKHSSMRQASIVSYDSHIQRLDKDREAKPFRSMLTVDIQTGDIKHDEREKVYWK